MKGFSSGNNITNPEISRGNGNFTSHFSSKSQNRGNSRPAKQKRKDKDDSDESYYIFADGEMFNTEDDDPNAIKNVTNSNIQITKKLSKFDSSKVGKKSKMNLRNQRRMNLLENPMPKLSKNLPGKEFHFSINTKKNQLTRNEKLAPQ